MKYFLSLLILFCWVDTHFIFIFNRTNRSKHFHGSLLNRFEVPTPNIVMDKKTPEMVKPEKSEKPKPETTPETEENEVKS